MKEDKIWELAKPYLKKGMKKNFVLHTEGVLNAIEMICREENGNLEVLIPAAILHDTGWAIVSAEYQKLSDKKKLLIGEELHIEYGVKIAKDILKQLGYDLQISNKIIDIIRCHKFTETNTIDKKIFIDADNLADIFKEQFYSDSRRYQVTPWVNFNFRKKNKFFTQTAQEIFDRELAERKREIEKNASQRSA